MRLYRRYSSSRDRGTPLKFDLGQTMSTMEHLIGSLENAPVVDRGEYEYFVHPVTDGIPLVEAELMREIGEEINRKSVV